jgi:hypothetical protein
MVLDAYAETRGDAVDRPLEARVVEGHEPTALLADEVMVVLTTGVDRLEARLALIDSHPLDETVLDQQVKDTVDAGAGYGRPLGPKRVLNLDGAERTRLAGKQLDDPLSRATALVTGARQHGMHMLAPSR